MRTEPERATRTLTPCHGVPRHRAPEEGIGESELQVAAVTSGTAPDETIRTLLQSDPGPIEFKSFGEEQKRDAEVMEIVRFWRLENYP